MGVYVCMNMHKEMNKMNIHFLCIYTFFRNFEGNVTYQPQKTLIIQRK